MLRREATQGRQRHRGGGRCVEFWVLSFELRNGGRRGRKRGEVMKGTEKMKSGLKGGFVEAGEDCSSASSLPISALRVPRLYFLLALLFVFAFLNVVLADRFIGGGFDGYDTSKDVQPSYYSGRFKGGGYDGFDKGNQMSFRPLRALRFAL